MNWLEAALAFALIMLVLATIVTIMLETVYRLLLTRENGFRLMMARLFDTVLKPRVAHLLREVTVEEARKHFLDAVTRNQAYEAQSGPIRGIIQRSRLSSMTTLQFAERLADTEVGKAIARVGPEYVENAINDLAQKFERFGEAASQRFQDHARFWCVLTSVLLAFVVNIDAVRIFQALLHDDALTSGVIARYGSRVDENAQRPQNVGESLKLISELQAQGVVSPDELKIFKQNVASAQLKLAELHDTGLPMTTAYWPFCTGVLGHASAGAAPKPADGKCSAVTARLQSSEGVKDVTDRLRSGTGALWLLSVLLAGLLIGLGAPFWFDLAQGLTRSAQLLRATGLNRKQEKAAAVAAADVGAAPPPRTPVEAFTVAIAASHPARARRLLSPVGRPVQGV